MGIFEGGISVKIKDNALVLSEHNLKMIFIHIGLCAESCSFVGGKVEKMDFIELFKDSLENNKWLNDFEDAEYERIEIEFD